MDQLIFDLIVEIQKAALDKGRWVDILRNIAALTNSHSAVIYVMEDGAVVAILSSDQDFATINNFSDAASADLPLLDQKKARFAIQRIATQSPLSSQDASLFDILQRHVHQSLIIQSQVEQSDSTISLLREAMNKSPKGIVVVEGNGTVVHANTRAETIINMNDGVSVSRGNLYFVTRNAQQAFQKLLSETGRAVSGEGGQTGACLWFPDPQTSQNTR